MKRELRKRIIELRKTALSSSQRHEYSIAVANKVLELEAIKTGKNIFCYCAYGEEVETDYLIDCLLSRGKNVYLPRCNVKAKTMTACKIKSREELLEGAYGILEPKGEAISPSELDFSIIPLVAFDRKKARLGYGGGYYDRFLPQTVGTKCGIAFAIQEAESVPCEEFDVPLDMIITETEVI